MSFEVRGKGSPTIYRQSKESDISEAINSLRTDQACCTTMFELYCCS